MILVYHYRELKGRWTKVGFLYFSGCLNNEIVTANAVVKRITAQRVNCVIRRSTVHIFAGVSCNEQSSSANRRTNQRKRKSVPWARCLVGYRTIRCSRPRPRAEFVTRLERASLLVACATHRSPKRRETVKNEGEKLRGTVSVSRG